MTVTAVA